MGNIKKVLIIDDDKNLLFLLEEVVKTFIGDDKEILKAERGNEGLSLFLKELPEIVLCDINLPDESGITLIKKMRKMSSSVKIMAMSGYNYYEKETIAAGADYFLQKPFAMEELKKILLG